MIDKLVAFLGGAIVPIAVIACFVLARKYLPIKVPDSQPVPSAEELDTKFARTQWAVNATMIAIMVVLAWSSHVLLVWLNRQLALADSPEGVRLWPQPAIWWFLPGFGALSFSCEITLRLWALRVGREQTDLFNVWSNRRSGFDSRKLLRWFSLMVTIPIGLATLLALSMHATLKPDEIRDCGYGFKSCQTFRYSDARQITQIKGSRDRFGKLTDRAGIVVDFADGRRWSSAEWGEFKSSVDPEIVSFIVAKTQLPMNYAETAADIRKP